MGNTPSSEEAENKMADASRQSDNNTIGAQGWRPPSNPVPNAPAAHTVTPNSVNPQASNQPTAPGWSVPVSQQNAPVCSKEQEANTQTTTSAVKTTICPPPPAYDHVFKSKQPVVCPQSPTAPPQGFMPQQTFGMPPTPQFFPAPQNTAPTKFYAQPKTYAAPQKKPSKFSEQSFGASGNIPQASESTSNAPDSAIWVTANQHGIPPNAFEAGHDIDGSRLFICRVAHEGDIVPGKVVPHHGCAYISYAGKEHAKHYYEILVGKNYRWVPSKGGRTVQNAVEGGKTRDGEKLYIGRVSYKNGLTPGKIHPSHNCVYIPFAGRERSFNVYEVLVHE